MITKHSTPVFLAGLLAILFTSAMIPVSHAEPRLLATQPNLRLVLAEPQVKRSISDFKLADKFRGKLVRSLGFKDGPICVTPPPISTANIDFHRSLFVHDAATLDSANFSLRRTLQKLANDVSGSVTTTPEDIFTQLMDTQNDTANQVTAGNPHCSDNDGKVNGFPHNKCPRPEGIDATNAASHIDSDYKPLAMVNRIDLAHKGWRNCGEHRIIYGKSGSGGKNLIIFEAVLPNPKPGCRSGCRDVIEFWLDLSTDPSPASRATKLSDFYYNGLPGFDEVIHTTHYSATGASAFYGGSGSGQIRTNQFLSKTGLGTGPWTLKEFKTFLSRTGTVSDYDILPTSVKVNPYGPLWNKDVAAGASSPTSTPANTYATPVPGVAALATDFQSDVIAQVNIGHLADAGINAFSYAVDLDKNSAESQSQSPLVDHYRDQMNGATNASFRNNLSAAAGGKGLTANQVVNRAAAMSCAGCHNPGAFGLTGVDAIGPGLSWPAALSFVHVEPAGGSLSGEAGFNAASFDGNSNGFVISPALLGTFLPARATNLASIANEDVCDCVRVPGPVRFPAKQLRLQKIIIDESTKRMRQQLKVIDRNFGPRARITKKSDREVFARKKAIIRKEESKRDAALQRAGLKFQQLPTRAQPVLLSTQPLSRARRQNLKLKRFEKIVSSEPPRETVNGSFRTH